MNDLQVLEQQLQPLSPRFAQVLGQTMPVEQLIQTVVVSVERNPALLRCNRQSILQAAMSAACLGLPVDGVTGQAFLVPFGQRAQLIIGYRGYNTLAARGGITITGGVVREGDDFEFEKGSAAYVRHRPLIGAGADRRIIAAWACANHADRPPIIEVMDIDELMAVKAKSPGAKKSDSPWNDPKVGFPAMCEKTPKRRLARSLPLTIIQLAAKLEEALEERGKPAWITPDRGLEIDGEAAPVGPYEDSPTPSAAALIGPGGDRPSYADDDDRDYAEMQATMIRDIQGRQSEGSLDKMIRSDRFVTDMEDLPADRRTTVRIAIERRREQLTVPA